MPQKKTYKKAFWKHQNGKQKPMDIEVIYIHDQTLISLEILEKKLILSSVDPPPLPFIWK